MPFDMTSHNMDPNMPPTERARYLRRIGKSWSVVAVALRPFCTRQERDDIVRHVYREELTA